MVFKSNHLENGQSWTFKRHPPQHSKDAILFSNSCRVFASFRAGNNLFFLSPSSSPFFHCFPFFLFSQKRISLRGTPVHKYRILSTSFILLDGTFHSRDSKEFVFPFFLFLFLFFAGTYLVGWEYRRYEWHNRFLATSWVLVALAWDHLKRMRFFWYKKYQC